MLLDGPHCSTSWNGEVLKLVGLRYFLRAARPSDGQTTMQGIIEVRTHMAGFLISCGLLEWCRAQVFCHEFVFLGKPTSNFIRSLFLLYFLMNGFTVIHRIWLTCGPLCLASPLYCQICSESGPGVGTVFLVGKNLGCRKGIPAVWF